MPGVPVDLAVDLLVCFPTFAREAAGAVGTRHSPRPPGGRITAITRVHRAARMRRCVWVSGERHPSRRAQVRAPQDEVHWPRTRSKTLMVRSAHLRASRITRPQWRPGSLTI